jgi:hypothetical protein
MADYCIDDVAGRIVLEQICSAADTIQVCVDAIARDGPLVRNKNGGFRDHPLLKIELQNRSFVVRMLHRLGLDAEPLKSVGRPPGGGLGWRGNE